MLKKPNYKKLDLQVYSTFFEIYSGKASYLFGFCLISPRKQEPQLTAVFVSLGV